MRALREIIGGLSLAFLAVVVVIGGLWLAVTETQSSTPPAATAVAANASPVPTDQIISPSNTASAIPIQATTAKAVSTKTSTATAAFTATLAPTSTRTSSPTALPTQTALPSPTLAPTQTTIASPTTCFPPPTWVQYTVAPGDTLFQLSLRFGVSMVQLQQANCLPTSAIKFNQVLFVPFVPSATPEATATVTFTATAIPNPLQINGISLIQVQVDASRPNGAIATLFIDFTGGAAPYTVYNDNQPQAGNPFPVLTECGGTILHTLRVLSGDGQSVEYPYYYSPVTCP